MAKLEGTRQRKGWVDTGRANAKLRDFTKPEVDVGRLGVQLGPSAPKPGSRLKKVNGKDALAAPVADPKRADPVRRGRA